ncbi:cytochrome P450 [Phlebopus sp. FC_14]|nr:cytochrome P450 [Phlebopus sp. FC_14]
MTAPGLLFLGRYALLASLFCFASASIARLLSLLGTPIPTWLFITGLVASLPLGFSFKIQYVGLLRRREAALLGAREMPVLLGQWFGNVDLMFKLVKRFKYGYPGDGPADVMEEYGNCFNFRVMFNDMLYTCEPEHIKAILATDFDNFVKGDEFRAVVQRVLGNGVFNSDGEMWKFHRAMTRPFFTHDRISHFDTFDRHAEDAIHQMKLRFHAGYPVDFQDLISRFTLDSTTEFLFGKCVHSLSVGLPYPYYHHAAKSTETPPLQGKTKLAHDYTQAFAEALFAASERPRRGVLWPLFEMLKDKTEEPMKIVNAYLEPILQEAIGKQKMVILERGEEEGKKPFDEDTLLDYLVRQTMDPVVLRDEMLSIMVAGRNTTASTLTFAVYLLSTHPHVLARLREEIINKVGVGERPTYEHIRELKYLRAVINETLRLYPAVPFNIRESIKATTLPSLDPSQKPYYVPPNTSVTYSVFLMHRRKDLWGPDAEEFDPDRFLDERLHKYLIPQPFIFLPFNAGPRICLGQQFAYNEMSYMLIRLLQSFTSMTLATDAQPPETLPPADWAEAAGGSGRRVVEKIFPKMNLTMYVHGGLWVRMAERGEDDGVGI